MWDPDDTDAGREAVEAVVGTVDDYPVEVDDDTASEIREEYAAITGGDA